MFWALCPDLVGHKRAGTAIGVMNFCAYLFAGLGEPLIGGIMDAHHDTSLVILIVAIASALSATGAIDAQRVERLWRPQKLNGWWGAATTPTGVSSTDALLVGADVILPQKSWLPRSCRKSLPSFNVSSAR